MGATERHRLTEPIGDILARLETLHPKRIDLELGRTVALLARVGDPHHRLPPTVHIAGTNGKGSVLAFTRAVLAEAGARVHAYTSPHLVRFNERIELAGAVIGDADLAALLGEVEAANEGRAITFFEISTAAALLAFSRVPADYLLLETGLGGRFDATNVVDAPAVTAITPVSLDHQGFLGDTLDGIAREKAGILKPGVPAVIGRQDPLAGAAIEARALEVGAPLRLRGRDWDIAGTQYRGAAWDVELAGISLAGPHQLDNAAQAVAVVETLGDPRVTVPVVETGLAAARWPGRLQRLTDQPAVRAAPDDWQLWLDGGHNPAAGAALAAMAQQWRTGEAALPLLLVFAMMGNKDAAAFLAPLAPHVAALAAVALPGEPAGLSAEAAAAAARACGIEAAAAASVEDALKGLAERHRGPARVLICGSLYLAGSVLAG